MATTITLAEAPKSSDIKTQIQQVIDVRPKLESAIEEQKQKLIDADGELARNFLSSAQTEAKVDVEKALQSSNAYQESQSRTQQRIDALTKISEKVKAHFDQLKVDYTADVADALALKLKTLESAIGENKVAEKGLADEIKKTKEEIKGLPSGARKKEAGGY